MPEHQKCELCGARAKTQRNGVHACSTCAVMVTHAKSRPAQMLEAIRRVRPEILADFVQNSVAEATGSAEVRVLVESKVHEQLAEAVGYQGDDGAELVAAVVRMATESRECEKGLYECSEALRKIARAVRYRGDGGPTDLYEAVVEMADHALSDAHDLALLMDANFSCETVSDGSLAETVQALSDDLLTDDELADRSPADFDSVPQVGVVGARDSVLLDVALDVMTGRITGLGADKIIQLRAV